MNRAELTALREWKEAMEARMAAAEARIEELEKLKPMTLPKREERRAQ